MSTVVCEGLLYALQMLWFLSDSSGNWNSEYVMDQRSSISGLYVYLEAKQPYFIHLCYETNSLFHSYLFFTVIVLIRSSKESIEL